MTGRLIIYLFLSPIYEENFNMKNASLVREVSNLYPRISLAKAKVVELKKNDMETFGRKPAKDKGAIAS